jgi:two-component system response regulator HydG
MGASPEMKEIMRMVRIVAPTSMSVLIEGETGTGKEYVSRAIHYNSKRKDQPFVAVDCGAIPHELANSELFGHVKGSFTGAIKDKTGSFETAHGGTLFLDEIGNLPYEVQVKLLRVIQERIINRVGENRDIRIDVRIIAASNQPLINLVKEKKFRDDLFHRLNEFKIEVPPLNKRPEDILVFADHFLKQSNDELDKFVKGFSDEVKNVLEQHIWLGNLRELKNIVKRSVLLCQSDYIEASDLPDEIRSEGKIKAKDRVKPKVTLKEASHDAEREVIIEALERTNFNKSKAAKLLKIDRKTLYNKLNSLGIDPKE